MGRICLAVKGETGIEWSHLTPTTLKISAGPLVGSATNPSLVTIEIPVLGPGETYDFSAAITMGMATLLPETLFLRVDPGNTVSERDLLNNLAVVAVVGEPRSDRDRGRGRAGAADSADPEPGSRRLLLPAGCAKTPYDVERYEEMLQLAPQISATSNLNAQIDPQLDLSPVFQWYHEGRCEAYFD